MVMKKVRIPVGLPRSLMCLVFGWAPALAELQPLVFSLNATPASSLDLSGKWHATRDPGDTGKSAEWFRRGPTPDAVPIEVPGPIEATFPGYDGVTWYCRSFETRDSQSFDDVRIHFQGADYYAEA